MTILFCSLLLSITSVSGENEFVRVGASSSSGSGKSAAELIQYYFQLMNGLKSDDYVPGSINCGLDALASNNDILDLYDYFSDANEPNRPQEKKERIEQATFMVLKQLTSNFPDTMYNCYFIPQVSTYRWHSYLKRFRDLGDFEAGFVQNIIGNALSLNDIVQLTNEAVKENDRQMIVYQVGRLVRKLFDFQPMKSSSHSSKKLQTTSSPFETETVDDMRKLHDSLMQAKGQDEREGPRSVGASFFVNKTDYFSVPFYTGLGFTDGAFFEQNATDPTTIAGCRVDSIRLGNNATMLAWHSELNYSVDRILLYAVELTKQTYPFSYNCYFTVDEVQGVIRRDNYLGLSIEDLYMDAIYSMREHTDAARRIFKLFQEVLPYRQASGHAYLLSKDWYVLGINLGIIFRNIAERREESEDDSDSAAD